LIHKTFGWGRMRYHRLNDEETGNDVGEAEMTNVVSPMTPNLPAEEAKLVGMTVKVLYRERTYEISCLNGDTTVVRLKELIESSTDVPAARQRLIFAGRALTPNDKTLSFFKIQHNSSIHLFPLPVAVPAAAMPEGSGIAADGLVPNAFGPAIHNPAHFDPMVVNNSREVKIWSILLIFLSSMALFNNFSYYSATGKLGMNTLDSVVFLFDTFCSGLGTWVGILGLKSVRTLDLNDVQKYVRWLAIVGVCSIILRIMWVFDIVYAVKDAVKQEEDRQNSENNDPNNPDVTPVDPTLNDKAITTFAIQASIIAVICIIAWSSCFMRAWRLQTAVRSHAPPVNANATNAVDPPQATAVAQNAQNLV
jgi:hypothetical protein